jgi:serine/threonine protein kinase
MAMLSPSELLDWLGQFQFLSAAQMNEIRPSLASFPDTLSLAKELIRRSWLTPYQINQIMQGKQDQLVLGAYRLRERLGEGAMGQVFKAWSLRLERVVAVKTIHKELVNNEKAKRRFDNELETAAQLDHPNIALVRDADEADGKPFLIMDFIDGINLSQRVKQQGPLPIQEAVECAYQTCIGLQYAYEHKVVHRDIKPANLIVTTTKTDGDTAPLVKILDFGLARYESERENSTRLTQVGNILGTIDYVAPEQARDARGADIRADIYSLGCTLFYLLAGRPAFLGSSVVEKLGPRMTGDPPSVRERRPEVPEGLDEVLRTMMARQPEDRYQTPSEAAEALLPFTGRVSTVPIAQAAPGTEPASSSIVMALPVPAGAATGNVPMAQPVVVADLVAETILLPPQPVPTALTATPLPAPRKDGGAFLGMSATGRDMSTLTAAATPSVPVAKRATSKRTIVIIGGALFCLSLIACVGIFLVNWFSTPTPVKGTLLITKTQFSMPDKRNGKAVKPVAIPGRHHTVHVYIQRADFKGPVEVMLKDLPAGVVCKPVTIPANANKVEVPFTVSWGTLPIVAPIRVVAECEAAGAMAEAPMTLEVADPAKLR